MLLVGKINLQVQFGFGEAFGKVVHLFLMAAYPQHLGLGILMSVGGNLLLLPELRRGSNILCGWLHGVLRSHRNIKYVLKHLLWRRGRLAVKSI